MAKANENHARYLRVLAQAHDAARNAVSGMKEDMNALDCGFAWVVSHDRAFNTWCRKQLEKTQNPGNPGGDTRTWGSKHYAAGWSFWCPGDAYVQSIGIHMAGANAFRDVLAHGLQIRVETGSRYD